MSIFRLIKKLANKIIYPNKYSNEAFCNYLKKNGATIGSGTRFVTPKKCLVDGGRLDYISIGKNCCIVASTILAHDYSWYVLLNAAGDLLPDSGEKVTIGDNVFIGDGSIILKGVTIGDNVIIGARSVVTRDVPSNCVCAGNPARVLSSMDEFVKKKRLSRWNDFFYRCDFIYQSRGRIPTTIDLAFFAVYYLERTQKNYDTYIRRLEFNGMTDSKEIRDYFFCSQPVIKGGYSGFLDMYNKYLESGSIDKINNILEGYYDT